MVKKAKPKKSPWRLPSATSQHDKASPEVRASANRCYLNRITQPTSDTHGIHAGKMQEKRTGPEFPICLDDLTPFCSPLVKKSLTNVIVDKYSETMKNRINTKDPGVLVRAPDGELYHISLDELKPFKLTEDMQKNVSTTKVFQSNVLGRANSPREVGLSASDEPTQTAVIDLSFLFR